MTTGKPASTTSAFRQVASLLAVVVGGMVLVGWTFDVAVLKSVLPGALAVKPNTALAFILAGLALRFPSPETSRFAAIGPQLCALLVGLTGLLTLGEYVFAWNPGFDQWLFRESADAPGTSHPGRMAPDTALCFVLIAAALAASRSAFKHRWALTASVVLGSLVTGVALAALLTAFTPDLRSHGWWGLTIMAPVTATLLGVLGATLVVEQWQAAPIRWKWSFAFATVTLLLLCMGFWYYRAEAERIREGKYEEIAAVGTLKAGQIQQWRQERLNDAARMAGGPLVRKAVMEFLREPDGQVRADLLERFKIERTSGGYADAQLFAPDGTLLLTAKDASGPLHPATQSAIAAALASREAVLSDFFRHTDGSIQIDAMAAVRDAAGAPLAVTVLRSDAAAHLYPLIQKWPTPSRSAETFIVQREGDGIVFLNNARHQTNTALTMRQSLSRTEIPAVQAALGRQGVFEGVDYRSAKVLSDLRPISGSPWFIVAKVDTAEIFSELRTRTGLIALVVGSLILVAAGVTGSIYRLNTAQVLRLSEVRFRSLVEATSQIVWTTDPAGNVEDMPAWRAYTGQTIEEVRGARWAEALHPEDRARALAVWQRAVESRSLYDVEYRVRRHDGEYRYFAVRGVPVLNADGSIREWVGTCADIHTRKQAEAEIRKLNATLEQRVHDRTAQLETANKELEAFAYSVSHDLRAPLRGVDGYARMLKEDYAARLDVEGNRLLDVVCGEARRMGRLIDDLLAFSRLGRQGMSVTTVDMTELARSVFETAAAAALAAPPRFDVHPLPPAQGDLAMLRQVFTNLLSNAVKFSRRQPEPVVEVGSTDSGGETTYYVKDNGVGFDQKFSHKLFGVFQRLHSEEEFEGTGVGLALVQRIIHRHGGKVWAEGQPGAGATFYFTLPTPTKPTL